MQIAVNLSPQSVDVVWRGLAHADIFKCPAPFDPEVSGHFDDVMAGAQSIRPAYVHFPLNTCDGSIAGCDTAVIDSIRASTRTALINIHLSATADQFPGIAPDDLSDRAIRKVTDRMIRDTEILCARFGNASVIAENVVYRTAGRTLAVATLPQVIGAVVETTGCGLLLDTAHSRLSAQYLGMDAGEYIQALPLRHVKELHVTGIRASGKPAYDSMPMEADDWEAVELVYRLMQAGQCQTPWVTALEYGGIGPIFEWRSDAAIIAEQMNELIRLARLHGLYPQ
jgi:uncharacterized protein (UPF0276 family)